MIKYLFSNVDKVNGFNEQQIKYLSIDLKTCKSILFVPGDYDKEKYIIYKDKIIGWFENIDIIFKEKHLASLDGELKCYDAIYFNDYSKKVEMYDGLGLTDINVYPHFDITNEYFVEEVKMVSRLKSLIALPNNSFIKIDDKQIEFIGDSFKIDKENIIKIN